MLRIASLLLILWLPACSVSPELRLSALHLPAQTTQVILSTTDDWQDPTATVRCFERSESGWQVVVPAIAANVGRSGLGWGIGAHVNGIGPTKCEGDGRAPAGIFALGTAFGYAEALPQDLHVPYRQATDRDYFVDASDSPAYNQWQHIPVGQVNDAKSRWTSFERMRRPDALYELGMVVNHNMDPAVPGRGSAIFLHVWSGPGNPTAGCTAMARADLLRVMTWLRADAQPLLVQVPRGELPRLQHKH